MLVDAVRTISKAAGSSCTESAIASRQVDVYAMPPAAGCFTAWTLVLSLRNERRNIALMRGTSRYRKSLEPRVIRDRCEHTVKQRLRRLLQFGTASKNLLKQDEGVRVSAGVHVAM